MLKKVQAQPLKRSFEIRKDSANIETNEIEFVFSTGAQVTRAPWFSEPYIEELSLDQNHVRLERLNNKAPILNSHRSQSLEDVLGVVSPGSAKTNGKEGTARARLSDRESIKPVLQDIKNGILNHVSVGYRIYTYRDITGPDDKMTRLLAVDWEPFEISLVPVGADDLATLRAENFEQNACEIISKKEENPMGDENKNETMVPEDAKRSTEEHKKSFEAGAAAERARVQEITDSCKKADLEEAFTRKLIDGNVKIDEARAKIIDAIAEKRDANKKVTAQHVTMGENVGKRAFVDGACEAMLHRARPNQNQIGDLGKKFRYMSMIDMLRFHHEKVLNRDSWAISKEELIRAGLHSTSDFAEILANVAHKSMMQGYKFMGQTFEPFVVRKSVKDFKEGKKTQIGEFPSLLQKNEAGEFKSGTIAEGSESYQLVPYGRDFNATREIIINDDMDVFSETPYKAGIACNMLESDLVYAQLTGNPTMGDGVALFHATHANYVSSGTAIDVANLGLGKSYVRKQKGLDGVSPLNLAPITLLVPTALETKGEQYTTILGNSQLAASEAANRNPHIGRLTTVSEPRLDDASATAWYLCADKNQIDIIMLGYLEGQENGPVMSITEDPGVGIKYRVYADRVAKILDHRGVFKNVGA